MKYLLHIISVPPQKIDKLYLCFSIGFRPIKGGQLIRLMRRCMCTGQTLFPVGIEPGIPRKLEDDPPKKNQSIDKQVIITGQKHHI
ncbi:hypothetical protein MTR_7g103935 [Medicago truncatula]|uniref:Uncharacterized protein n=1 Tax=Medicago truncatula TaxID=3880 RepID=A0A072UE75_MEDTR|nr:hypothetical protein MTR_7g103935 [Medicago truncatula]